MSHLSHLNMEIELFTDIFIEKQQVIQFIDAVYKLKSLFRRTAIFQTCLLYYDKSWNLVDKVLVYLEWQLFFMQNHATMTDSNCCRTVCVCQQFTLLLEARYSEVSNFFKRSQKMSFSNNLFILNTDDVQITTIRTTGHQVKRAKHQRPDSKFQTLEVLEQSNSVNFVSFFL